MYLFLTAADSTGAARGGASMILMFVVLRPCYAQWKRVRPCENCAFPT